MISKSLQALFLFILFISGTNAQNLVLNPGFENYIICPGFGQFGSTWVNDWNKPSVGSSDYYNDSCPGIVPAIGCAPRAGNAEAGIILFNYGAEYREYITATLSQPLVAGKTYPVEFYVALNPGYIQAVKNAGAYFSDSMPGFFSNSLTINITPQINNSGNFLSYGWNKISGNYLAVGGELYMTIGNFYNDSNTATSQVGSVGSFGSYYFVDDVFVGSPDSTSEGITDLQSPAISIYPNPATTEGFTVFFNGHPPCDLYLYNSLGQLQLVKNLQEQSTGIDLPDKNAGLYYYMVRSGNQNVAKGKLLIGK